MKIVIDRLHLERGGLAILLLILLPLFGVLGSRFLYEFIQGIWWYDTSTERTIFSSIGGALSLLVLFFANPLRKTKISVFDFLMFTYFVVWTFSLVKGVYSYGFDKYVLKQVFTFATMLMAYVYGKSWQGSSGFKYAPLVLLVLLDTLITLLGVYPNAFPLFTAVVFLGLIISIREKKYAVSTLLAISLILSISDINRTLMLWMLLILLSSMRMWISQLPRLMVVIVCLVAASPMLIEENDRLEKSKTEVRIEQMKRMLGLAPPSYEVDISTMDRKLEAWAVEDKFEDASLADTLLGFGAGAKYDVALMQKVILDNANVHMGPWYELLNRGLVGVILLVLIFVWSLYLLYKFKEHQIKNDRYLEWMLAWLFIVSIIFWMTWSNFVYTAIFFWFYLGRLSGLAKNIKVVV